VPAELLEGAVAVGADACGGLLPEFRCDAFLGGGALGLLPHAPLALGALVLNVGSGLFTAFAVRR
jgi:hypothetical protein